MERLARIADIVNDLHEKLADRVRMLISENERLEDENAALRQQIEHLEDILMMDEEKYLHVARR